MEEKKFEYTQEDFLNDKCLASYVYKKHFYNYTSIKDDLIQCCIIKLYNVKKCDIYDESKGKWGSYAYKICKNTMLRYIQQNLTEIPFSYIQKEMQSSIPSQQDIVKDLENKQQLEEIQTLLANNKKINKRGGLRKKIIQMHFVQGLSQNTISDVLKISHQYVSEIVNNVREILTTELNKKNNPKTS